MKILHILLIYDKISPKGDYMLTNKQQIFLNIIIEYFNKYNYFPTLLEIKEIGLYKSYNSIYQYLNILNNKNIIEYDKNKKRITYLNKSYLKDNFIIIPFIDNKESISIDKNLLDLNKEYIAFQIKNNYLKSYNIQTNDILIIEKNLNYLNNKFILINYENKLCIYKYIKKDSFINLLNDKEILTIENNLKIIGKVSLLIRKNI